MRRFAHKKMLINRARCHQPDPCLVARVTRKAGAGTMDALKCFSIRLGADLGKTSIGTEAASREPVSSPCIWESQGVPIPLSHSVGSRSYVQVELGPAGELGEGRPRAYVLPHWFAPCPFHPVHARTHTLTNELYPFGRLQGNWLLRAPDRPLLNSFAGGWLLVLLQLWAVLTIPPSIPGGL